MILAGVSDPGEGEGLGRASVGFGGLGRVGEGRAEGSGITQRRKGAKNGQGRAERKKIKIFPTIAYISLGASIRIMTSR
jgi:hypothetical protein